MDPSNRTELRIDLGAIRHNGEIARRLFPEQKILSVLKADAYGHGIAGVVPAYETVTDWYAAATAEEGLRIRSASRKPVLLFGPVPEGAVLPAAENGLTFTVGSVDYAKMLSARLTAAGLTADCHLKIDTGLNRTGLRYREGGCFADALREIQRLPGLRFTGTYTHFACGEGQTDWELAFTETQFTRFRAACGEMERLGFPIGIRHCCATGGALAHPDYRLDMVRLGMLPLGMSYSDGSVRELGLIPAMTWAARIAQIETVEAGEAVSYGCTFRAERRTRIAIVTCGYADGYHRSYSGKTAALVCGRRAPVVGRIAMDYTMLDVTEIPEVKPGMEALLLGTDGVSAVSAQEISELTGSVSGEVTCSILARVPRIYIGRSE